MTTLRKLNLFKLADCFALIAVVEIHMQLTAEVPLGMFRHREKWAERPPRTVTETAPTKPEWITQKGMHGIERPVACGMLTGRNEGGGSELSDETAKARERLILKKIVRAR